MNNKSYSNIFLKESGLTILSVASFLCLLTYFVFNYNSSQVKNKELETIENNILSHAEIKLAQIEHIIETLSQNSLVENYYSYKISFDNLINKLTIESSVFEIDEIAFSEIDGNDCKNYNLITFDYNANTCKETENVNLPFNQWTNHETNTINSFYYKTYVRSKDKNEIIGTLIGTIHINGSSRSLRRLFDYKDGQVHLTTKNTLLNGGKIKTTYFSNLKYSNPTVPITFTLDNIKGPQTIYKIAIDSSRFENLTSSFEYILICAISIIFVFVQGFISYSSRMNKLDKRSLFKLSNGIPLSENDLENCPSELYSIEQEIEKLRHQIKKKDFEIKANEENLKIQKNVIQREFSERVQVIQRISKQNYIDRENSMNRLKQSVRSNVNAAHIKINSLHDDLLDMNAGYESMDKLDATNAIVDHIGQDILTEVDNLNPFTIRNQKIRDAVEASDIANALREKGFTININKCNYQCEVGTDIKHLIHKTILDVLMFLLEESVTPDVINVVLEVHNGKVISLKIDTDCVIKESMNGNKYYYLEMAKERVSMFGINCDVSIIPTFSFSLVYIDYDTSLDYQPESFNY